MRSVNIHIRDISVDDAAGLLQLQKENRDFFESYAPTRTDEFYTMEGQLKRIQKQAEDRKNDQAYNFGIFTNTDNILVGTVSLFQVMRGPLQSAYIGYDLDRKNNGRGYTTDAVRLVVDHGFNTLKLHRIEAGAMTHNIASIRVLEKAGFQKEGIARQNVHINGKWEDHQILAILNPCAP
ncbi:ribosomal-protein-alanine N-acetyltransferase [Paenibacillus pabuli]|uniref:Ribosomal-protein-alanine N-acetyltransferase n=1 Tax=Paenibacillus pabuli TaxID=1472 RepID=A0ABX9BFC9_9BACL|nr:GNAT family protein [Paenibacillus pabuli]RAI89776.1 ribosomal-protein-alanine N-acetyltransferase [Paenibacillus pabuli]